MVSILLNLLTFASAYTVDEWKSRTIYQIVTDRFAKNDGNTSPCTDLSNYCGGGFKGIQDNLDYIQGMGFDAIWISPVVTNAPPCYHGYCALDYYTINDHFGGKDDLVNLIEAMHKRNMWLMLDVVANHSIPMNTDIREAGQVNPFNKQEYYHNYCTIDWNNRTSMEDCWLGYLADLNQSVEFVETGLLDWISYMVTTYDIDGLRIDTCLEVPKDFWYKFHSKAGVYSTCEAFNQSIQINAEYQGPVDAVLNYPLFFNIKNVFAYGNSMYDFRNLYKDTKSAFSDIYALTNFADNHDNPRFLSFDQNINNFKNAIAFSMTWPGIPILYYGDEQAYNGGADPNNREPLWGHMDTKSEMYQFVKTVVQYRQRNEIWKYEFVERYALQNLYCFTRGLAMMCFTNSQNTQKVYVTYHPYNVGDVVCNIFWAQDCVTVSSQGMLVQLNNGEVKLYELQQKLEFE